MPLDNIHVDYNDLPPLSRRRLWQDLVGEHLADVELIASPDIPACEEFSGTLRIRSYRSGTLADISAGGQILKRTSDRIRRARSDNILFNVVLAGRCRIEQDGRQASPGQGSIFLYDCGRPYHIETSRDFKTIVVMTERSRLERSLGNLRFYTGRSVQTTTAVAGIAGAYWLKLFQRLDDITDEAADSLIDAGIEVMRPALATLFDAPREGSESCEMTALRARTFVACAYHRKGLAVDDIATAAGVSVRRLQECFKEKGVTPKEYLRNMRLQSAYDRLAEPGNINLSVTSIVSQVGFNDPAYFSKAFRQRFGLSPTDVKEKARHRKPPGLRHEGARAGC